MKKLDFDFGCLPAWANWIAMDKNKSWYCYENKPISVYEDFHNAGYIGGYRQAMIASEIAPKFDGDWKDSLLKIVRKKWIRIN